MRKGFELLTTRTLEDKIDILALEEKYNLKLPPIYRLFVESFILGENQIKEERVFMVHEKFGYQIQGCAYLYNREASISHFNELEKVLSLNKTREIELWDRYLPIAAPAFNGAVLLGLHGSDADKIFLHDWELSSELTFIASNIFEYVRGFLLVDNIYNIGTRIHLDKLYKNWGEDFWRIREE